MPISGDVVDLDFGLPAGFEAGFGRPAVIVTAQRVLDAGPEVLSQIRDVLGLLLDVEV